MASARIASEAAPDVPALLGELRATFDAGVTRPAHWRKEQLRRLEAMIRDREAEIFDAVQRDLGKCALEAYATESGVTLRDVRYAIKHLAHWMQPEKIDTPLVLQPGSAAIHPEPYGVVLIIGPWNYPFYLMVTPLVGAIAAGNCALLKPSELTPHTSAVLARGVADYLNPRAVRVVEGGVETSTALLRESFDYIFFTGGTGVGRVIMKAAAEHLTPVTLELGGKSPCVIDADVDMDVAARRVMWGKCVNSGQTCVAPDYVLVHESRQSELLGRLAGTLREFYGDDPQKSPDLARIVSDRHFERLVGLMDGGRIVAGGQHDAKTRFIAPTLLTDVDLDSPLMQDEIFGPLLPIVPVADVQQAMSFIRRRPKPLALYVFTRDRDVQRKFVERTSSGGLMFNDTVSHLAVDELPFGGVGPSGMGAYHGRHSFETFSHRKGVVTRSTLGDVSLRYPPYTDGKLKWARRLF